MPTFLFVIASLALVAPGAASLALLAQAPTARSPTGSAAPPVLSVGAHRLNADGRPLEITSATGSQTFEGFLWSDALCTLTSSEHEPPRPPAVGWHFTARVSALGDDRLDSRIEWQRRWQAGARATGASRGSIQRVFYAGDRLVLDRVDVIAGACGTAGLQLEVAVNPGRTPAAMGRGGRGAAGAAGAAPGSRPTTMAGRGGVRGAAPATATRPPTPPTGRGGGRGVTPATATREPMPATGRGGRAAGAAAAREQMFTAELWLVHQSPDAIRRAAGDPTAGSAGRGGRASGTRATTAGRGGFAAGRGGMPTGRGGVAAGTPSGRGSVTSVLQPGGNVTMSGVAGDEVLRSVHRFSANGTGFAFPALSIDTARGPVNVIVTGTVSVRLANGVPSALIVTIRRQTTTAESGTMAEGTNGVQEIPWDRAREVVSFELPTPRGSGADPLAGHKLELRIRVSGSGVAGGRGGRGGVSGGF